MCFMALAGRAKIADMIDDWFYRTAENFRWDMHDPVSDGATLYARYTFSYRSKLPEAKGGRAMFTKSPVKRIGRDRFVRNVLIAIGNSGDASLAAEAELLLGDASPLVRGAAVWALSQLMEQEAFVALAHQHVALEQDGGVRAEWDAAITLSDAFASPAVPSAPRPASQRS